jgi:site-specific DNA-cytosine methylase
VKAFYNDIDAYCCKVLRHRIERGDLPEGDVVEGDIRDINGEDLREYGHVHLFAGIGGFPLGFKWAGVPADWRIVTGGFPCQDISGAGPRVGINGPRSGLWREMFRIICELRPDIVCVENVADLLIRGIGRVLGDLASIGYDCEWDSLRAHDFGAPHLRERVFIVANAGRFNGKARMAQERCGGQGGRCEVAKERGANRVFTELGAEISPALQAWNECEPVMDRMAHGIPKRVDRAVSLGNAIVPQIAEYIGHCILAANSTEQASEGRDA